MRGRQQHSRSTDANAFSACLACDSTQLTAVAGLNFHFPSSQATNRPAFTICMPAIDRAFCDCIVLFPFSKAASCMHDNRSGPAGLPEVDHACTQAHCHFHRPQTHGTHRCCSHAHFALFKQGRLPLLNACMRRRCVPTSSEPLRRLDPWSRRMCPERRIRLRCSCVPTFRPGCIAFAAQVHAQGRAPLHEHAAQDLDSPQRLSSKIGRAACAPTHTLHGIHGSETLPLSSARRLCSMLLVLRVNNTFACFSTPLRRPRQPSHPAGPFADNLAQFPANSTCPPAGAAHRVARHTWASIPDAARIMCRIRWRACRNMFAVHNPQPTSLQSGFPSPRAPVGGVGVWGWGGVGGWVGVGGWGGGVSRKELLGLGNSAQRPYPRLAEHTLLYTMRVLHGPDDPVCICGTFAKPAV